MLSLLVTLIVFSMLGMIVFQTLYVFNYQSFLNAGDETIRAKQTSSLTLPAKSSRSETKSFTSSQLEGGDSDEYGDMVYSPPAAIVLCLKGAEESLCDCLTGLISQQYPDYELNIVIYSPTDSAAEVVKEFFSGVQLIPKIHYLEDPAATCSLKCSAICQAIDALSARIEVVAFVDGDAVVDEHWLSDLVSPLSDSGVGATTGNRWYSPADNRLGSFVRKIWNAAAIVQMQRYEIAWGGTLAIRKNVIDRCELVAIWRKSFCEDTPLANAFGEQKLRLHCVPNLIIENKESVSTLSAFHWISRQLLTVRLHHPAWNWVLVHGIVTGIASIVAPLLIVLLFCVGMTSDALTLLKTAVVYQVFNFALLYMIGKSNRKVINGRESYNGLEVDNDKRLPLHFFATLVTQVIQPFALWQANSMEKVNWRGATYGVKDGNKIRLLKVKKGKASPNKPTFKTKVEVDEMAPVSEAAYIPGSRYSKRSRN